MCYTTSMLELIQPLLQYHEIPPPAAWESILGLSDEQFVQEIPYSHGSIRNQMVHLAAVEGRWLRGLKGIAGRPTYNPDPAGYYPTRQSAYRLCRRAPRIGQCTPPRWMKTACCRFPQACRGRPGRWILHVVITARINAPRSCAPCTISARRPLTRT